MSGLSLSGLEIVVCLVGIAGFAITLGVLAFAVSQIGTRQS